MTARDYEKIAATVRYWHQHCDNEDETATVVWIAEHLANTLEHDPRFDRVSFIGACTNDTITTAGRAESEPKPCTATDPRKRKGYRCCYREGHSDQFAHRFVREER